MSKSILVVANETVAGRALIDAVRRRAEGGEVHVHVICPQNAPKRGLVITDQHVRDAAENRLEMTIALLKEAGIEADGEVMDPDPYAAVMDALADRNYDEIIVSTHPETRSGWLRQGLIDRLRQATGRDVEHVVVDLEAEDEGVKRTLVVANQTVGGKPLIDLLKKKAEEEPRRFIVISPERGEPGSEDDTRRLAHTIKMLEDEGLDAIGQVVHPDPYVAVQNALQDYAPDDIVISTLPDTHSGWLRSDLVGRVQSTTSKPVEHVVVDEEAEVAT
jgi:nucleotide-binding universal stress UspA family protein